MPLPQTKKKEWVSFLYIYGNASYSLNPVHKKSQKQPPADLPQLPTQLSWVGLFVMPHTVRVSWQQSVFLFLFPPTVDPKKKILVFNNAKIQEHTWNVTAHNPSVLQRESSNNRGTLITVKKGAFRIAVATEYSSPAKGFCPSGTWLKRANEFYARTATALQ